MRTARTFTLDQDIAERLRKEENQSDLINKLIGDYFKTKDFDGMTKEQLEAELAIVRLTKDMDKKIKEIRKNAR